MWKTLLFVLILNHTTAMAASIYLRKSFPQSVVARCSYWLIRTIDLFDNEPMWKKRIKDSAFELRGFELNDRELMKLRHIQLTLGHDFPVPENVIESLISNYRGPRSEFYDFLQNTSIWLEAASRSKFWMSEDIASLPSFGKWMKYWEFKTQQGWKLERIKFYQILVIWLTSFRRMFPQTAEGFWRGLPNQSKTLHVPLYHGLESPWPIVMLGWIYDIYLEEQVEKDSEIDYFFDLAGIESGYGLSSPIVRSVLLNAEKVRFQLELYAELRSHYPQFRNRQWESFLAERDLPLQTMQRLSREYFHMPQEKIRILSGYSLKNFLREPRAGTP
jgi:hypothetical protein